MNSRKYKEERVLVKVGSGYFFDRSEDRTYRFLKEQMDAFADEVSGISEQTEVMVVSSGAIATAAWMQKLREIPEDKYAKARLSSMGQSSLMASYQRMFSEYGKSCAQVLITSDDFGYPNRRRNIVRHQEAFFRDGVIAIYNENDIIATDEITFGDNDILAAHLAVWTHPDMVVMLSHATEGLGSGGGESKEEARKILSPKRIGMEVLNNRYEKDPQTGLWKPNIRTVLDGDDL